MAIDGNLNWPGKNWIKTKPTDNKIEDIANRNFLDIDNIIFLIFKGLYTPFGHPHDPQNFPKNYESY